MSQLLITPRSDGQVRLQFEGISRDIDLPEIFAEDDYRLLRWYFEDYAENEPFQTSRAEEARELVSTYGRTLIRHLEFVEFDLRNKAIQIKILPGESKDAFWEALERLDSWPSSKQPSSVTVTRCVEGKGLEELGWMTARDNVNILVVIARPQLDRDIPHRFVSSTIVRVAEFTNGKARVEIVRPGTFAAFVEHLEVKPKGFFDVVHFDMHGEASQTKATLSFLQKSADTGDLTTDPRSARDVAEVLAKSGVRHVVLNACRSATVRGSSDSNIATTLVSHGVPTVLAMSYKIASSAVDQMVRAFYKAILLDSLSFADAARESRAAMFLHPAKQSRFGIKVDVLDFLVPRCFQYSGLESGPLLTGLLCRQPGSQATVDEQVQDLVGRENDILLLESKLLMDSNIGIIWGEPGTGKTALLDSVSEWWYKTFMIQSNIYFNLDAEDMGSEVEEIDMAGIEAYLAAAVLGTPDKAGQIVHHLNEHPYLIAIDHLEAWKIPQGQSKRMQQKLLKDFLAKVHGGRSFFIFASRRPESWLENLTPRSREKKRTFSQQMTGLAAARGTKLFLDEVKRHDRPALVIESVTSKYLEAMGKLVSGNPLALKMLAYDFCQSNQSIKDYFSSLLQGNPIARDQEWIESEEGARIVRQLQQFSNKCQEEAFFALVMAQFRRAASQGAESHNLFEGMEKPPPLHPAILAMLWMAVPAEDLWKYVSYFSISALLSPSTAGISVQDVLNMQNIPAPSPRALQAAKFNLLFMSPGEHRLLADLGGSLGKLRSQLDDLVHSLQELDLLCNPTSHSQNDPKKPYYRINAVFTIFLRGEPDFKAHLTSLRETLVYFQLQSCLSFPYTRFYWNPEWIEARKEIGHSFYNYYGALLAALRKPAGDLLTEGTIFMLISNVSKGLFTDRGRYELLSLIFEETLERGLVLLRDPPTVDPTVVTLLFSEEELGSLGRPQEITQLAMRCVILLETMIGATGIRNGVFDSGDELREDLVPTLRPHVDRALATLRPMQHAHADMAIKCIDYSWEMLRIDPQDQDRFWKARHEYYTWLAERNGDEFPHEQFRDRNVPHWLNSLTLPTSLVLDVESAVVDLTKRRRFDEARRVVQQAMEADLTTGSNQITNRIRFLRCLVDIDEKDEKWDDAIANTNLIHELEDSLPGKVTLSDRITREQNLANLYDHAGDVATTRHLVKKLLRRANSLHATDRALEFQTLMHLSNLPIVRRLDWDISAIYLLVRAMLTRERGDAPTSSAGSADSIADSDAATIMAATMKLTNATKPQWMLGPADSRPQSVAIYFLATMFGQLIFMLLNMKVLARESPSVRSMALAIGIPNGDPKTTQEYTAITLAQTIRMFQEPQMMESAYREVPEEKLAVMWKKMMPEMATRLFAPRGSPRELRRGEQTGYFGGVDLEKQRVFFDHFFVCGERWLAGEVSRRVDGSLDLDPAPWTPATMWGTVGPEGVFPGIMAMPKDYRCPTEIMLRLAGYIVDDD